MQWFNEPPHWQAEGDIITVTSAPQTDFWRKTHSGQINDNGHFYYEAVSGNFISSVKVSGAYADQYDQAGMMVRLDEQTWLKCGLELFDGVPRLGAVVTNGYSDWSLQSLAEIPAAFWLKVSRHGGTFEVEFSLDGTAFHMIRQTYLTESDTVEVGLMTCSPIGNGFASTFAGFRISTS